MRFHLGDILTVTTDKFMAPDGFPAIYRILNHLTGDNLMTHQLSSAAEAMTPWLAQQFPALRTEAPAWVTDRDTVLRWLAEQVALHGEWHEVVAPSSATWGEHDALEELMDLVGPEKVLVLPIDQQEQ